jgi:hypothetical protein
VFLAIWGFSGDVAITVLGAALIAVFTGLLTAHTTNQRQERQLEYERVEADRAELRDALDGAAAAAIEAMRGLVKASGSVDPTRYPTDDPEEVQEQLRRHGREQRSEGFAALGGLTPHLGRFQLRLSAGHPVVRLYARLTDAGNEVNDAIPSEVPGTARQARESALAVQSWTREM